MSDAIIQVENLAKKYVISHQQQGQGKYVALRDVLANGVKSWFKPEGKPQSEEFWALRDVSFEVQQGECIGIIGRNGAGKSTLLKILSRITEPTLGRVSLRGRVASLLEVGTGFHPELTGRENIYLNGAILGMAREEIKKKFDEIVAFAEVERFLDTPVKRYSSGMYMRLAFAVAANLEPEILVVDEVLAVGDIGFQKKCLGKMGDVASREGRTVLFVSHNMGAITQLCQTSIWLSNGKIIQQGKSREVVDSYLSFSKEKNADGFIHEEDHAHKPKGIIFSSVAIIDSDGKSTTNLLFRQDILLLVKFDVVEDVRDIRIGVVIHSLEGNLITAFHQTDDPQGSMTNLDRGVYQVYLKTKLDLIPGFYTISLVTKPLPGFWNSQDYSWDHVDNALMFTVISSEENNEEFLPSGHLILPMARWFFKKCY